MQYSKPMIDLVMEVRRRVPSAMKPGIKLANPDVLNELADYYPNSKDTVTRALIKELMQLAGDPWQARLQKPETPEPRGQLKVYRGRASLTEKAPGSAQQPAPERPQPVRMYRGQVVR